MKMPSALSPKIGNAIGDGKPKTKQQSRHNDDDDELKRSSSDESTCSTCSTAEESSIDSSLSSASSVLSYETQPPADAADDDSGAVRVVCGLPYNYTHRPGSYTGEVDALTSLPHGIGTWRSTDKTAKKGRASMVVYEGKWMNGYLYHKPTRGWAGNGDSLLTHGLENIVEHEPHVDDAPEDFWVGRVEYSWGETELGYSFWEDESEYDAENERLRAKLELAAANTETLLNEVVNASSDEELEGTSVNPILKRDHKPVLNHKRESVAENEHLRAQLRLAVANAETLLHELWTSATSKEKQRSHNKQETYEAWFKQKTAELKRKRRATAAEEL